MSDMHAPLNVSGLSLTSWVFCSFFSVVPIFIDIAVAMVYLTRTFSWTIGVTLFIIMYACE